MKKLIYITLSLSLSLIYSCDNRKDYWGNENTPPGGELSSVNNAWSDNDEFVSVLEDSLKNRYDYQIAYSSFDNLGQTQLMISKPKYGKIYRNNTEIDYDVYFALNQNYINYYYSSDSVGYEEIYFTSKDPYDLTKEAKLLLTVFDNYGPTTNFDMNHLNNLETLEYEIDASASFDGDQKFGGELVLFQYVVDNDTTNHPDNKMNYIFPESREYVVSVRCMDNDSIWSDFVSIGNFHP